MGVKLVANTSQFKSDMSAINREMRVVKTGMQAAAQETDKYGNKVQGSEGKIKGLSRQLELQRDRVKRLKEAHTDSARQTGKNSDETLKLETRLNRATAEMNKTEGQLKRTEHEMKQLADETEKTGRSFEEFDRDFRDMGGNIRNVAMGVGATTGIMFASLVKPMKDATAVTMTFEAGLSEVQAISRASAADMALLEQQAKDLGKSTKFSATEATEAMSFLAMAGQNTTEIMGTMPQMLDLAAASNMDLARTADITTNIMSAMGMEAEETGRMADVLALGAATANTDVAQLGEAMKMVAPIGHSLGLEIEELTAGVGTLSDAGIQGSQAGRVLRQGLVRLSKPTGDAADLIDELGVNVFDSEGKMKSLDKVVGELERGLEGQTDQARASALATIFGSESMAGWTVLLDKGEKGLSDYTKELEDADGAAKEMADTMQDNAQGAVIELKSAIEGLQIELGQRLMPAIGKGVDMIQSLVDWFGDLDDATKDTIVQTALFTTGILGVTTAVAGVVAGIGALMAFAGPIGMAIVGGTALIGGLSTAIYANIKHTENLAIEQDKARENALRYGEGLSDASQEGVKAYTDLEQKANVKMIELRTATGEEAKKIKQEVIDAFSDMADLAVAELEKKKEDFTFLIAEIFGEGASELEKEYSEAFKERISKNFDIQIDEIENANKRMEELLEKSGGDLTKLTDKQQNEFLELRRMFSESVSTFAKTQDDLVTIQSEITDKQGKVLEKEAEQYGIRITETYTESVIAANDYRTEMLDILDDIMANTDMSQDQYNTALASIESESQRMIAEGAENYRQSGELLNDSLDERGRMFNFATGQLEEYNVNTANNYEQGSGLMYKYNKDEVETQKEHVDRVAGINKEHFEGMSEYNKDILESIHADKVAYYKGIGETQEQAIKLADEYVGDVAKVYESAAEPVGKAGQDAGEAFNENIKESQPKVKTTSETIKEEFLSGLRKGELPAGETGKQSILNFNQSMAERLGLVHNTGEALKTSSIDGLKSNKLGVLTAGGAVPEQFSDAALSKRNRAKIAGEGVANSGVTGLRSVSSTGAGSAFTGTFNTAVGKGTAYYGARAVANKGVTGLRSVKTSGAGSDFVSGFRGAIERGSVMSAASALGRRALSALSTSIARGSPSRITGEYGDDFVAGFDGAIIKSTSDTAKSAAELGKQALGGLSDELEGADEMALAFDVAAKEIRRNKDVFVVEHQIDNSSLENKLESLERTMDKLIDFTAQMLQVQQTQLVATGEQPVIVQVNDYEMARAVRKPINEMNERDRRVSDSFRR